MTTKNISLTLSGTFLQNSTKAETNFITNLFSLTYTIPMIVPIIEFKNKVIMLAINFLTNFSPKETANNEINLACESRLFFIH